MTRGINYLLVDLPDLGKAYDKGLSLGRFHKGSIGRDFGHEDGWLYQSLFRLTFDEHGMLMDPDPLVVSYTRQVLYMYKKVKLDCPNEKVVEAIDDFKRIEELLQEPDGSWGSDTWLPRRFSFRDSISVQDIHPRSRNLWGIVDRVFGSIVPMSEMDYYSIIPKHGPGAVSDLKTGMDKYQFVHWPSKLEGTFPSEYFMYHKEGIEGFDIEISREEPPARLIAVPKTFKGPRIIASEPVSHQFLQQGVMRWLRANMTRTLRRCVDFTDQSLSQEMVRESSRTGTHATVDLSSASDRLSCWAVERAFGSNQSLLRALHACRTRSIVDATGSDPDMNLHIKKFAAQGSAVTFPVQSMVYAGLAISAVLFDQNLYPSSRNILKVAGNVRVFGDDIIIPKSAVQILVLLLESIQLKVNASKTHDSGHFRESCGLDGYKGYDVTPCYISAWTLGTKPKPEEIDSWIAVSNNAHKSGLWRLSKWMMDSVPDNIRDKTIITQEDGDGFRFFSYCQGYLTNSKVRWCKSHHVRKARLLTLQTIELKKRRWSYQDLYQYLLETPSPEVKWEAGYLVRNVIQLRKTWVATPEE